MTTSEMANRRLWRAVGTSAFATAFAGQMLIGLLPVLQENGLTDLKAGVLIAAFSAGQLLGLPFWSAMADHHRERTAVQLSGILLLLATMWMFIGTDGWLIGSRFFAGLCASSLVATLKIVHLETREEERAVCYARVTALGVLGAVAGLVGPPTAHSFLGWYGVVGFTFVVAALSTRTLVGIDEHVDNGSENPLDAVGSVYASVCRRPSLAALFAISLASTVSYGGYSTMVTLELTAQTPTLPVRFDLLLALIILLSSGATLLVPILRHAGDRTLLAVSLAAAALCYGLAWLPAQADRERSILLSLSYLGTLSALNLADVYWINLVSRLFDQHTTARAFAIGLAIGAFGRFAGAMGIPALDSYGICLGLGAIATLIVLFLPSPRDKK